MGTKIKQINKNTPYDPILFLGYIHQEPKAVSQRDIYTSLPVHGSSITIAKQEKCAFIWINALKK